MCKNVALEAERLRSGHHPILLIIPVAEPAKGKHSPWALLGIGPILDESLQLFQAFYNWRVLRRADVEQGRTVAIVALE